MRPWVKHPLTRARSNFCCWKAYILPAVDTLKAAGYSNIVCHPKALPEEQLKANIADAHFIGIRSRTQLTEEVLGAANKLIAVGCFCIGTNQVNLKAATERGIVVFNAPFSNTRSVAELVIAEAILLLRGVAEKNALAHRGIWQKSASSSYEIRGKQLGIIGYGSIGMQLGIIAESLGMQVMFLRTWSINCRSATPRRWPVSANCWPMPMWSVCMYRRPARPGI